MDSTGENWKIQVPEQTAMLLRDKGYTCVPRGEINVKGKGIMLTYWVLGKNESISRLTSPTICPAGIPSSTTPSSISLQRQTSNHSSLAAVVFGIMQATKRNTPSTRKFSFLFPIFVNFFHRDNQQYFHLQSVSTIICLKKTKREKRETQTNRESNKYNEICCTGLLLTIYIAFPLFFFSFWSPLTTVFEFCSVYLQYRLLWCRS